MELAGHLETDDSRNPVKVLTALDFDAVSAGEADVEILSDGTQSASNHAGVTQQGSECQCGLFRMFGALHIGRCRNLHKGHSEPVECVYDDLAVLGRAGVEFSRRILL